jgi:hypothetical protein
MDGWSSAHEEARLKRWVKQRGHAVDFLSIILSAIGWGKDRADRVSDRRIEAYRLNAEVAAEAMNCVNILAFATPDILRRAALFLPNQQEVQQSVSETLTKMRTECEQLYAMAESYKPMIEAASARADWDKAVRMHHEWRATASAMRPYIEGVIQRYDNLLNSIEQSGPPSPTAPRPIRPTDRGWDAPPL